jgi:chromosome segregation ATPase
MTLFILAALTLSVVEIIILQLGAVILGIAIHFFLSSRRSLKMSTVESDRMNRSIEDWKLKYFNEVDSRDKELFHLKEQLAEAEDCARIYRIEMEEQRHQIKKLEAEKEIALQQPEPAPVQEPQAETERPDYIEQLRQAQSGLKEHNEKINRLLDQIDVIKEKEEQQQQMQAQNDELADQIGKLKSVLGDKEKEINNLHQKEYLTREMTSLLDNAYNEFNILQGKLQKLESQVSASKMVNVEFEELKETHYKTIRDYEDQKVKLTGLTTEHTELKQQLGETEEKLKEANLQRQQLQKRVAYLEELNNDLHVVADAHKKLESNLKRIGELESMLNIISVERDELLRKQTNV